MARTYHSFTNRDEIAAFAASVAEDNLSRYYAARAVAEELARTHFDAHATIEHDEPTKA